MKAWHKGLIGSLLILLLAWQYGANWDQRINDTHERTNSALRKRTT